MCGRYLRRSDKQRIAEAFHLGELPDGFILPPDFNIAPSTFQPVIRNNHDTGERELVSMRWGLIPYFAKSASEWSSMYTINAKAESLLDKALWRLPFQKRRCLVPADGFYEWQKLAPKSKKAFVYVLEQEGPFAFAGLWDAWKDPATGEWLQTFAIITTVANDLTGLVHDRMPVLLHSRDYDRWLEREPTDQPPLDLLKPFDAELMKASPCNPAVANVRNNGPEMLVCPDEGDTPATDLNSR